MPTSYGLLSTYPPTQCGLATFTAALLTHLPEPGDQVSVVRVLDEPAPRPADEVVHDLVADSVANASAAAEVLNSFDVVIVQHEYGIYGGPDGPDAPSLPDAPYVPSWCCTRCWPGPRPGSARSAMRSSPPPAWSSR